MHYCEYDTRRYNNRTQNTTLHAGDTKPVDGRKQVPLGPHSRWHRLANLDERTSEGLIVNRLRKELFAHVGGHPSVVERVIIERCCFLQLRLALLDKKMVSGHNFTEIDSNSYIAWSNALVRTMSRLGFEPKTSRTSLEEILAEASA